MVMDEAVHMGVEEVQARCRSPVADKAVLHILARESVRALLVLEVFPHERIRAQIDLADGQVVRAAPVAVKPGDLLFRNGTVELFPGRTQDRLSHERYSSSLSCLSYILIGI